MDCFHLLNPNTSVRFTHDEKGGFALSVQEDAGRVAAMTTISSGGGLLSLHEPIRRAVR